MIKKKIRSRLKLAKLTANAEHILKSANPYKTVLTLINRNKPQCTPLASTFASANDFNDFFVSSLEEIDNIHDTGNFAGTSNIPNVDSKFNLNAVNCLDIVKVVHRFKTTKSRNYYRMMPIF